MSDRTRRGGGSNPGCKAARNLVTRADGKLVNVARKTGQLFFCVTGCCCGRTDEGHAAVPQDLYHDEWIRRRLRNKVHLTASGCLGPCPLSNVVMLLFDGRSVWFHSMNSERQVVALYDYIEQMLEAQAYLPPTPALAPYHFTAFNWEPRPGEGHDTLRRGAVAALPEQSGFLFLTHADTDILALSRVASRLETDFPPVKAYNLSNLKTDEDIDAFLAAVLPPAEVIVLRLLGSKESFRGGFERILDHVERHNKWLVCVPGTDVLDPELTAVSNVGVPVTHEVFAYLQLGGLKNYEHMLRFLSDHLLSTGYGYDAPEALPRHGVYHPDVPEGTLQAWQQRMEPVRPTLGVLFYRSHLLSGNTDFVDALVRAGEARGANVLPVYAYSLKEYPEGEENTGGALPSALRYFVSEGCPNVEVLLSTMSFALGGAAGSDPGAGNWSSEILSMLDVPVIQAVTASSSKEQWDASLRGLTPLDNAMNVAIPEFDGRIISVPVSFKQELKPNTEASCAGCTPTPQEIGSPVVKYVPVPDRVERVVGQAMRLAELRRKPNGEKRIAFALTNYNAKVSRIANAVGLDSPASLLRVLEAMKAAGYQIENLPPDGDTLLQMLVDKGSYDLEVVTEEQLTGAAARVPAGRYREWFGELPPKNRAEMESQWGSAPGRYYVDDSGTLALAGVEFGNAFVAIQPPRGYGMDPAAIYHMPDLPPPHPYHALYRWISEPPEKGGWGADAVVHLGKHGTLEWLPGKGIGVSSECYPDLFLGDLPLVYPFIINNPGEGAQAKRRTHAVVVDHLTPPMTTAEGYGEIEELARLVDEYYQMEQLDPSKLPLIQQQIWELIKQAQLDQDLGQLINWDSDSHTHEWDPEFHEDGVPYSISDLTGRDFAHLVENVNGYLCELTSAQIRDGLHILGQAPEGTQLVDSILSLVRVPNLHVPSLRFGIASHYGLHLDTVLEDLGCRFDTTPSALQTVAGRELPTHADALEAIDLVGHQLIATLADRSFAPDQVPDVMSLVLGKDGGPSEGWGSIEQTLSFVCRELVPNLRRTDEEIGNVLHALDGGYIPAGPSGAPTRGMAHILPTGRNFYAVDPRGLPSLAAWRVGQGLADALIERHLRDEGRYPESVGISIWGTSAMRTHGDDIAEVLALLGVRPRWQAESRRVSGLEVIPLEELGRPRIDVICRISGFFRDAFPHLIALLDEAFSLVASLDEQPDRNYVRRHQVAELERLVDAGMPEEQAADLAAYRIFGCKPGTYGAGILPLIDESNWQGAADFAEAYVNWGGYAYTAREYGVDARPSFRSALAGVQVAVKNQDNREHDIFDSDDYLQYHGGMIATIRALTGKNPRRYFGDSADPERVKVRDLKEEAQRVFRTRVINPKWIGSIQRHGYKGALELAATVDYLFGYDATADVVDDWMYARVAETYALDPAMQEFFRQSNPWALRDISARLLEAVERGLWSEPGELQGSLERAYLDSETELEARAESGALASRGGAR
ncbi:MAG: cobaltochelatase subunit CobN [Chloroflexota bacterium]|nr:cobaltochelatase subunit CobN [Chloroflexota bacterium]